jgi:hypothetical protein
MKNLRFYDFIFIVSNEIDGASVRIVFIGSDNLEDFNAIRDVFKRLFYTVCSRINYGNLYDKNNSKRIVSRSFKIFMIANNILA